MVWRSKEHPCPLSPPIFGIGGCWKFFTGVWHLDLDLDMVTGPWYTHVPNFCCLSWFWRCREHPHPLLPHLGLWRLLEVPDWGLASWNVFGCSHSSLIHPCSIFWPSILVLKVQKTSMSFMSSFRALEDAWGSWLGFCILIRIWIWFLVFNTPMFPIFSLYLDFLGAKEMSFKSWCGALNDAWCSWLGFGIFILIWLWSLVFIHHWFKSLLSFLILKVQRSYISFESWFGAMKYPGGSWLGNWTLILNWR